VKVVLYTAPGCAKCDALKEWLKRQKVDIDERSLSDTDVQAELLLHDVFDLTAPILERDGTFYPASQLFKGEELQILFLERVLGVKG